MLLLLTALLVCLGPLALPRVTWGSRVRYLTDTLPSHLPLRRSSEAGIREPFLDLLVS